MISLTFLSGIRRDNVLWEALVLHTDNKGLIPEPHRVPFHRPSPIRSDPKAQSGTRPEDLQVCLPLPPPPTVRSQKKSTGVMMLPCKGPIQTFGLLVPHMIPLKSKELEVSPEHC